jgi:hypothetical protein
VNDIGWLFLFMSDFADNSIQTTVRGQPEPSGRPEQGTKPLVAPTAEQIVRVREFFNLIAKWEETMPSDGN